jgi:hypothetical protein
MREERRIGIAAVEQLYVPKDPLTEEEIEGIVLAVKSAFRKLKNLYNKRFGFCGKQRTSFFGSTEKFQCSNC